MLSMMSNQNVNLVYLAGLFDGEGNAGVWHIERKVSNPARLASGRKTISPRDVPALQLKMTDEAPVKLLHNTFGGCFFTYKIPSGKTVYGWRTSHRKAEIAAKALRPFVLVKGQQLDKVLAYYNQPKQRREL